MTRQLWNHLRELRMMLGISQREMAEVNGWSSSAVAGWETGYRSPADPQVVSRYIATLGMDWEGWQ